MLEFVDRFQFWCTTTCMDYVEVKNQTDIRLTGMRYFPFSFHSLPFPPHPSLLPRFCCWKAPEEVIYSENNQMIVIFHSTVSRDVGFKARVRQCIFPQLLPSSHPLQASNTTISRSERRLNQKTRRRARK